mgnify:CR=1 FL=1
MALNALNCRLGEMTSEEAEDAAVVVVVVVVVVIIVKGTAAAEVDKAVVALIPGINRQL